MRWAGASNRAYGVAVEHRPRPAPCTHCGDKVLVVVHQELKLFGLRIGKGGIDRLEHADPSPEGEIHDGVDDACFRTPVR